MRRWEKVIRIWGKSLRWGRWRSWMKGWWEGITIKLHWGSFLSLLFIPIWEEKIFGPGRKNFLPDFPLHLFSSHSQTEENSIFHSIFLLTFSILPKFHPTKHNVKETDTHIEGERKNHRSEKKKGNIHTHWEGKRRYEIFFFLFLGFGFRREGSWVVWKRKVLSLEEKPFVVHEKEGRRKKKVLMPFAC